MEEKKLSSMPPLMSNEMTSLSIELQISSLDLSSHDATCMGAGAHSLEKNTRAGERSVCRLPPARSAWEWTRDLCGKLHLKLNLDL